MYCKTYCKNTDTIRISWCYYQVINLELYSLLCYFSTFLSYIPEIVFSAQLEFFLCQPGWSYYSAGGSQILLCNYYIPPLNSNFVGLAPLQTWPTPQLIFFLMCTACSTYHWMELSGTRTSDGCMTLPPRNQLTHPRVETVIKEYLTLQLTQITLTLFYGKFQWFSVNFPVSYYIYGPGKL